jgi:hypothetical protein
VLLSLAGLLLWHGGISLPGFLFAEGGRKPAAVVNGEAILQVEFEDRFRSVRGMLERQQGRKVFSGERGKRILEDLKEEVLEVLIAEKLIGQEARRLGVRVSEERVQREMERVAREVFGTADDFLKKLECAGGRKEDLQNQLKNILLIEAIKNARGSKKSDSEKRPDSWLVQARRNARVEVSATFEQTVWGRAIRGSCCGPKSGEGRGKMPPSSRGDSALAKEEAKKAALEDFLKNHPGQKEITARVIDYGCHLQIDIQKDGKTIKSYTYENGGVRENS